MKEMPPRGQRHEAAGAAPPYVSSPTTGWPTDARCTRIWCVRPECRCARSRSVDSKRAEPVEVRARGPPGRARSPSACGRSGRARCGRSTREQVLLDVAPAQHGVSPRDAPLGDRLAQRAQRAVGLGDDDQARRCPCRGGARARRAPRAAPSASACPRPFSAFTSVPVQFPGAGCTTMPAGLSTTSSSSSSNTIASGMSSPSTVLGHVRASRRRPRLRLPRGSSPSRGGRPRARRPWRSAWPPANGRGRDGARRAGPASRRRRPQP